MRRGNKGTTRPYDKDYTNIHMWITYHYGKPSICENESCKKTSKKYEWALKKGHEHAKNIDNYIRLCRACHWHYDVDDKIDEWKSKVSIGTTRGLLEYYKRKSFEIF